MVKVPIGSKFERPLPRHERRTGVGDFQQYMPPMTKDSELIQAGLLDLKKEYEAEQKKWRWLVPTYKIVSLLAIFALLWFIFEMQ